MKVELGNWIIEKAKDAKEDDRIVPIRMIANRLDVDKENQQILPQAFNKATVKNFIDHGIIDYHHQSLTGKTSNERASAVLGKPYDFKWEKGLPVVYGNLTKSHPIVKNSILPHLEAGQKVFAASVGGSVKKARNVLDSQTQKHTEQILEIDWNHIAIAASPYVISSGSEVSMIKASNAISEPFIQFTDVSAFEQDYDLCFKSGDEIRKALEVGAGTDIATLTGADALRQQSKQKKDGYNYVNLVKEVAQGLQNESIGGSESGVKVFLKSRGLDDSEIGEFVRRFKKTINDLKE